jgi:aspartyl-tRNA(Asn)/glutamyl-tRNA(Gln) amidotransferase subunit A
VVGLKPAYGSVSRWGLISYASSLDTPGVIARTVWDAVLLSDVVVGDLPDGDLRDSTRTTTPSTAATTMPALDVLDSFASSPSGSTTVGSSDGSSAGRVDCIGVEGKRRCEGLRVGIPGDFNVAELDADVREQWDAACHALAEAGAEIVTVKGGSLPHVRLSLPAYYIIALAEASSNLSRYDGARYGHRAVERETAETETMDGGRLENAGERAAERGEGAEGGVDGGESVEAGALHRMYTRTRSEGFGAEVQRRILLGT